jgi:putative hydrolase of the HAD superfamily
MAIKNIILDLGGVILNIDYNLTIKAFQSLGISNFESLYTQAKQEHLFDHYEAGKIHSDEFVEKLGEYLDTQQPSGKIIKAWNAMLLDLPEERLTFLKVLRSSYNTSLLSNTNPIHIKCFHEIIKEQNGIKSLNEFFDHVHFSSDLGMRKPDPDIFKHVCDLHNYSPSETLFIDDSMQHVEGARKAGLHAFLLDTKKDDVKELVTSLLTKLD